MTEKVAKAGHLLCVDEGAYSDYSVTGFFLVLEDFKPMAELASYLDAHPEERENYSFNEDKFLAALLAKGLLLEIQYGTLHLGSYSTESRVLFTPMWTVEGGAT